MGWGQNPWLGSQDLLKKPFYLVQGSSSGVCVCVCVRTLGCWFTWFLLHDFYLRSCLWVYGSHDSCIRQSSLGFVPPAVFNAISFCRSISKPRHFSWSFLLLSLALSLSPSLSSATNLSITSYGSPLACRAQFSALPSGSINLLDIIRFPSSFSHCSGDWITPGPCVVWPMQLPTFWVFVWDYLLIVSSGSSSGCPTNTKCYRFTSLARG